MIALTGVVAEALKEAGVDWPEWAHVELEYVVAYGGRVYAHSGCILIEDDRPYCPTCGKKWDPRRRRDLRQVGW